MKPVDIDGTKTKFNALMGTHFSLRGLFKRTDRMEANQSGAPLFASPLSVSSEIKSALNDLKTEAENSGETIAKPKTHPLSKRPFHWGLALPLGALMTIALGVTMASLIAVEFVPQDKIETLTAEINPVVADIKIICGIEPPLRRDEVLVPPPPPTVKTAKSDKPTPRPIENPIFDNVFDPKTLKFVEVTNVKIDSPYQPLFRAPPDMPSRAQRSGHCKVRFDVSTQGQPFNVQITSCSEDLFARATIKSVQKWKYRPRVQDGQAITVQGVKNLVRFNLTDERGRVIPE